jgi:carboxyl-terminal processing protease
VFVLFGKVRSLILVFFLLPGLLLPSWADLGDAARFESALDHITRLARHRPTVERLLGSVRLALPAVSTEALTVSGLANHLAQSSDKELPAQVIRAMLHSLDDRWARLYSPQESQSMRQGLDGDGQGSMGLNLVADEGREDGLLISDVAPNGPAVGLIHAGERLQVIDGHDLREPSDVSLDSLLYGQPGQVAQLQIADRAGLSRQVEVERVDLDAPTAYVTKKDSVSTEVRITSFGADTAQELRAILEDNPTGALVLDLRCNGGGYVKAAVESSALFLKRGSLVVQTENRDGVIPYHTETAPVYRGNVCLLVNSKTASAAEIFTAALQHHLGAKVIGETTYGKGSVQRIVELPGEWAMKMTISSYRTAAGALIDGVGIQPDLSLDMPVAACRTEVDTQMDQARLHVRALAGAQSDPQG